MTAAEQLLARLDALRVQVRFAPETGKLRVRPSALVPPGLRQEIIDQADELIALVVTRLSPNWTDPAPASPADMPLSDPRPDLGRTRAAEIKMRSEPTNQLWRTDKWPNRRSPSPRTHNPMENTGTRWSPRGQLSPDVAAELRAFRRARGVSLRRLGRAAGVSVGFLSELERGLEASERDRVAHRPGTGLSRPSAAGAVRRGCGPVGKLAPNRTAFWAGHSRDRRRARSPRAA
jgi:hypothetical protein